MRLALVVLVGCGRIDYNEGRVDAPAPWTIERTSDVDVNHFAIWGNAEDELIVVGDSTLLTSTGSGDWTSIVVPPTGYYGVWGSGPRNTYVVGNVIAGDAAIYHLTSTLTREPSGTSQALNTVWGSSANDVYIVGYDGTILRSTGDGTWTAQTSAAPDDLLGLWGSGATDIYAVGDAGTRLHSTGDWTWARQPAPSTRQLVSVMGCSASDVYVVGHGGTVLHSTGDGTWTLQPTPVTTNLINVWCTAPDEVYATGVGGAVLRSRGDGVWTVDHVFPGVAQLDGIWSSATGVLYVVGRPGFIARRGP